jgi:hypothetical protein
MARVALYPRVGWLGRRVAEGEEYPDGYGLAWRLWLTPGCVAYPVPLNHIAGWLRDFWMDLRTPKALRNEAISPAFLHGIECGLALDKRYPKYIVVNPGCDR